MPDQMDRVIQELINLQCQNASLHEELMTKQEEIRLLLDSINSKLG